MTDEQMDARLRAAGEHWRAAEPAAAEPGEPAITETAASLASLRRRHWGLLASAAVVVAALVIGGTLALRIGNDDHDTPVGTAAIEGTVWQLLGYGDHTFPSSYATFYIGTGGQLVADDDCSLIGAKVDVSDGHVYPTDFQLRDKSCTDSTPPTFSTALDVLTEGPSYSVDGDRLTISDGDTQMHLRAMPGAVPPTLDVPTFEDTTWRLATWTVSTNGKDVAHQGDGGRLTVRDGNMIAADGNRTITADVAVDGSRVDVKNFKLDTPQSIDPGAEVLMTAGELAGPFEQVVHGNQLTITKKGAGTLVYQWVPSDPKSTDPNESLTGGSDYPNTTWHLASVAGTPAVGDATLRFAGGYVGTDGCSRFSGLADIGLGLITFTGVPKRPSCGGAKGNQATTIDSFLSTPALWSVRDGKLIIDGGGAQAFSLVYLPDAPLPSTIDNSSALAGTTWKLTGITRHVNRRTDVEDDPDGSLLAFTARRYTASYHCGTTMSGDVVIIGSTLTVSLPDRTALGSCPAPDRANEGNARQDQIVQRVLQGDVGWKLEADELILVKDGTTLTYTIG